MTAEDKHYVPEVAEARRAQAEYNKAHPTAEDKLKELYKQQEPIETYNDGVNSIHTTLNGLVSISAEDIDLTADLVVERLKEGK